MKSRLGRGLSSLLSDREQSTEGPPSEIEVRLIRPNPFQPREVFDEDDLEDLRKSILNHGLLQPVVVRAARGGYELVSGERRWRASQLAGLSMVPAIVRPNVSDDDMLELAIVENVQRQDLNAIERALGFQALQERLGLSQEGVATRVGLRRSTIANHLRLLELPATIQGALSARELTMGHAKALLAIKDPEEQLELFGRLTSGRWSVRDTEEEVRQLVSGQAGGGASTRKAAGKSEKKPSWATDMESRLQERFGTRCRVQLSGKERGSVQIDFFERDDLDRLFALLLPDKEL